MATGKGKKQISAKKPSRNTKNADISLLQPVQPYDADTDADMALALALSAEDSSAAASTGASASATAMETDDFHYQQHLAHLQAQAEADAEYARQLAEQFAAEDNQANQPAANYQAANQQAAAAAPANLEEPVNDIDDVLEEIARMEAHERLKKTGHAYNGRKNIDRILADEEKEEDKIREMVKHNVELREWRKERERQDAEYAAAQQKDRLQQELSKKVIEPSSTTPAPAPAPAPASVELEEPPLVQVPLSKEELRRARLAFFTTNLQKS